MSDIKEYNSYFFDIKIIFMTISTVLGHKNINRKNSDINNVYILNEDENKIKNTTEIK